MKNLPKNYFLLNVKIKNGIDTYFLKNFASLQIIEIKIIPAGNC